MAYAVMCSSKTQKRLTIAQSNARQAKGWATQCYSTNGLLCRQWLPPKSYGTHLQGNGSLGYYFNLPKRGLPNSWLLNGGVPTGVVYQQPNGQWQAYFSGVGAPKAYSFASGLQAMRWVHRTAKAIASGTMAYPNAQLGTWVSGYNGP